MMKLKAKLTKKQWLMVGGAAAAVVLLAVILCIALIPNKAQQTPSETETNTESTVNVSDIQVEAPETTDDTTADTTSDGDATVETLPDGVSIVTPDEKTESNTS
ncbi:MAG: hypothetical protein NC203_11510, partial [Firmicutes bacterium]|nr:hypothetical protein [Bacillota bacterium]